MIWPVSGRWIPDMQRTRVDLPAPLSPTSAVISPRRKVRSTSLQRLDTRRRTANPFDGEQVSGFVHRRLLRVGRGRLDRGGHFWNLDRRAASTTTMPTDSGW